MSRYNKYAFLLHLISFICGLFFISYKNIWIYFFSIAIILLFSKNLSNVFKIKKAIFYVLPFFILFFNIKYIFFFQIILLIFIIFSSFVNEREYPEFFFYIFYISLFIVFSNLYLFISTIKNDILFYGIIISFMGIYILYITFKNLNIIIRFATSFFIFGILPFTIFTVFLAKNYGKSIIIFSSRIARLTINQEIFMLFGAIFFIFLLPIIAYVIFFEFFKKQSETFQKERNRLLEERLKTLGQLSASLAHEINNSLGSIIGFSDIALENIKDKKIIKYISLIRDEAQILKEKLDEILSFTKKTPNIQNTNIIDILNNTIEFLKGNPEFSNIKVKINSQKKVYALIDPHDLKQIIINLLINSHKNLKDNLEININITKDDDFIEIKIKDNGPGIPDDIVPYIFEPFITGKKNGTGIGLFISQQLIINNKGELEYIKSKTGACFKIKLPRRKNE